MHMDYNEETPDANSRKVTFLPAVSESYTLWHKYRWMRITRAIETHRGGWATRETLTMRWARTVIRLEHGSSVPVL